MKISAKYDRLPKTLMPSSNIWRIQTNLLIITKFTFPVLWRRLFLLWRLVVICACVKTITYFVRHTSTGSGTKHRQYIHRRKPTVGGFPTMQYIVTSRVFPAELGKITLAREVTKYNWGSPKKFKAPNTHRCFSDLETDMERKTVSIVGSGNWWEKQKDISYGRFMFYLK